MLEMIYRDYISNNQAKNHPAFTFFNGLQNYARIRVFACGLTDEQQAEECMHETTGPNESTRSSVQSANAVGNGAAACNSLRGANESLPAPPVAN
jgi:hypothetical protein